MKLFKKLIICIGLFSGLAMNIAMGADVPTKTELNDQITALKAKNTPENKDKIQKLTEALTLLDKLQERSLEFNDFKNFINDLPEATRKLQNEISQLKTNISSSQNFNDLDALALQNNLTEVQSKLQAIQESNNNINTKLTYQKNATNNATSILQSNVSKIQSGEKKLLSLKDKEQNYLTRIELEILYLNNEHLQLLLKNDAKINYLFNLQLEENKIKQANLEKEQIALQEVINNKKLAESKIQAEELKRLQSQGQSGSQTLIEEQSFNLKLSQDIIAQTSQLNKLTQDDLQTKSILTNLQETQRNINERINALQGTLVLSRIIDKQKNFLPKNKLINNLGKQITDLRVKIFDLSELRDQLYNPDQYLEELRPKKIIREEDKVKLRDIINERYKLVENEIDLLNNQLNLLINIDVNQKQVEQISEELQSKLQQQSFWVQSNSVMDLTWFSQFFGKLIKEVQLIKNVFKLDNYRTYLAQAIFSILFLLTLGLIVQWQKKNIQQRLDFINSKINSLKNDRQYYTPLAIILTVLSCLPISCYFLSAVMAVGVIFENTLAVWQWGFQMALFLWFAKSTLKILSPNENSVACRHFNFKTSLLENVYLTSSKLFWSGFLWINANIFNNIDGITNDVLGQLGTIIILGFSLYFISPKIKDCIKAYNSQYLNNKDHLPLFLKFILAISFIAPFCFIVLIIMGYYFTTLNLMHHFIYSYLVLTVWLLLRETAYRGIYVFSRNFRYKQLLEKVAKQKEKSELGSDSGDDFATVEVEENLLDSSKIQDQILKVANLFLCLLLCFAIYLVWRDLLAVATYLKNINLWEVKNTGVDGKEVIEKITLFNLLIAVIVVFTTYALVKNLSGILEIILFSHIEFTKGTAYTINTLISYGIIALGTTLTLACIGLSWSKLQWILTAFSVGLGFGLQEIFANFVSGMIILFERPVRIGDVVTIDNFTGTVSKIRIRSTTLMDFDRKEIVVPNKSFVTGQIVNWALTNTVTRVRIPIGVAYGSDLKLVKELLLKVAEECPYVIQEPKPLVYFLNFGASTLDHELRVYVNDVLHRNLAIDYINNRIDEEFSKHGVEISFNQMDVYIKNTTADQAIQTTMPVDRDNKTTPEFKD